MAEDTDRGQLVWIASYYKSGNTWVRAFLSRYCQNPTDGPVLGAIPWISTITARLPVDFLLGVPTASFCVPELMDLRAIYQEELSRIYQPGHLKYFKTHDAFVRTLAGRALFSRRASQCAVYLVRNPLDVAVSFAHHEGCSIDEMIATMNEPRPTEMVPLSLPIALCNWSDHVVSWTEQAEVPTLVLRYEDMLAYPRAAFFHILQRLELPVDEARLDEAVAACSFSRLQAEEQQHGFQERPAAMRSFFREGRSSQWKDVLTPAQVDALVARHGPTMQRFGYLDEHGGPSG